MDPDWSDDAPLLQAWLAQQGRLAAGDLHPFTVPGHKQRAELVGDIVSGDLPLYGGLAAIRDADALLRGAEQRAAQRLGADWCRYSVGGSTHANQASALAVGAPGDTVVVDRTAHRSLLLGLVLAGLRPVWVHPPVDSATGLPLGLDPTSVSDALAAHPEACAVFVTSPSYVGTCADVAEIARVTRAAGVPLVVDAAWGAHLGSHLELPPHPFTAGADAVVISAHKALPALNQGALIVARTRVSGGLLDADRLDRAMEATATTSPSGAILASVDGALALLAARGDELLGALLSRVRRAREALRQVSGLVLPDSSSFATALDGSVRFDDAKLVALTAGTGADGIAVDHDLAAEGFTLEMADRDLLIPMVTLADGDDFVAALAGVLAAALERRRATPRPVTTHAAWGVDSEQAMTPREAFFAPREPVPWTKAAGRVCAEVVAPYPPGVPVLAPGERITRRALDALRLARDEGARIAYAADPTLETVLAVTSDVGGPP